jgi:hypothetical protein
MFGEAAIEDVLSNCHRDAGFETVSGTQAIGFVDEKSDQGGRRYRQKQGRDEGANRDEEANRGEEVRHDEVVVNEHDSCLRAGSVGERQGNEGGMCWRTYRLSDLLDPDLSRDPFFAMRERCFNYCKS